MVSDIIDLILMVSDIIDLILMVSDIIDEEINVMLHQALTSIAG